MVCDDLPRKREMHGKPVHGNQKLSMRELRNAPLLNGKVFCCIIIKNDNEELVKPLHTCEIIARWGHFGHLEEHDRT